MRAYIKKSKLGYYNVGYLMGKGNRLHLLRYGQTQEADAMKKYKELQQTAKKINKTIKRKK